MLRYSALFLFLLLLSCSNDSLTGGSTETELGGVAVTGMVVYSDSSPVGFAVVKLIPSSFNPIENWPVPDSMIDTTGISGEYQFQEVDSGSYNVIIRSANDSLINMKSKLTITGDTLFPQEDILAPSGAVQVMLPDSFAGKEIDLEHGYVFIEGTDLFERLSENVITVEGDKQSILFDNLPVDTIGPILYGEEYLSVEPMEIMEHIVVPMRNKG